MTFAEFLQSIPPGRNEDVDELFRADRSGARSPLLNVPDIRLGCSSEECGGERQYECIEGHREIIGANAVYKVFLTFQCRNCESAFKVYALTIQAKNQVSRTGVAYKFGEFPHFGVETPARVISLVGPDRDNFLKGRRCEFQGLGIGAFAYYRRIVETQKNRMIDEIIRVATESSTTQNFIAQLEAAKSETQFSRAVESIKDAIPESLRIDGHNPLALLHKALSEGLHAQSDDECLEIAKSIRLILFELADRVSQTLKDRSELRAALSKLL